MDFKQKLQQIGHQPDMILIFTDEQRATAESFNAKIKAFRAQYRGVANVNFFLFRLAKLYA